MTKRTPVERLARELYRVGTIAGNPWRRPDELETWESRPKHVKEGFLAAARHVLARERRARGRTVGWTYVDPKFPTPIRDHHTQVVFDISDKPWPDDNFRVVLVPRKRGGK